MGENHLYPIRRRAQDDDCRLNAAHLFSCFERCHRPGSFRGCSPHYRLLLSFWAVFSTMAASALLNASFVAAAQVLVYVGAVNVLILFAIMLVNKKEDLEPIAGLPIRRLLSGGVCLGLLALLTRVVVTTPWISGPTPIGEDATARIGEHLFTDYLLPFELASVLLLMAMIGAIVLARRDVQTVDPVTGEGWSVLVKSPALLVDQPRG